MEIKFFVNNCTISLKLESFGIPEICFSPIAMWGAHNMWLAWLPLDKIDCGFLKYSVWWYTIQLSETYTLDYLHT